MKTTRKLTALLGLLTLAAVPLMAAPTYYVYATIEGLIGRQTANGHTIVAGDHFVALPSRTVLENVGVTTYTVNIYCPATGKTVYNQPIWDIGPHNGSRANDGDPYWTSPRTGEFPGLATGLPEAQAAYQNGYNGGKDDVGRTVTNPAGIDLGDGTRADLGLGSLENEWCYVTFNWVNSGFDVSLKPTSITYPAGQEEVFAINSTDGNTWHAWNSGPGTGWTAGYFEAWGMQSDVAPVYHNGFMEIFAIGAGGYLNHNYNGGAGTTWSGWSTILAGSFHGNPAAIARPSGYMKVAVHNSDGTATDVYQNGPGQPWSSQSLGGGGLASDLTLIVNSNLYLQVFATDTSGYLVNRWDTGQGTAWNSTGWTRIGSGSCSGRPCAVVRPDGGVEVFVRNTNKSINHYYHGSFAATWGSDNLGSAGAGFASNVAGMASANGAVEIFVTDSSNAMYHKWNTGTGTAWGNWNVLAQGATSDPCVHWNNNGNPEVFYRGNGTKQIWHMSRSGTTWGNAVSLGGPQ